jgi:ABC-2 type transport system ATP-binding protein
MGRLTGLAKPRLKSRVDEVMESCGVAHRRRDLIGKLSRGYRQRVGLAQALVHDPDVLILDEPTASLDPVQIRDVREYIKGLAGNHTVILSTHILPEVELVCDRVLMINKGKIIADDTPTNLRRAAVSGNLVLGVEARGDAEKLQTALRSVPHVTGVDLQHTIDGTVHELSVASSKDIREEVAKRLVSGGFGLLGLSLASRSLEDIFVELTTEEPAAAAVSEAA